MNLVLTIAASNSMQIYQFLLGIREHTSNDSRYYDFVKRVTVLRIHNIRKGQLKYNKVENVWVVFEIIQFINSIQFLIIFFKTRLLHRKNCCCERVAPFWLELSLQALWWSIYLCKTSSLCYSLPHHVYVPPSTTSIQFNDELYWFLAYNFKIVHFSCKLCYFHAKRIKDLQFLHSSD